MRQKLGRNKIGQLLKLLPILLPLMGLLIGCGTKASSVPCPTPAIPTYSKEFNARLSEQIRIICKDPNTQEACRVLHDCYLLRVKIGACKEKKK